MFKKPASEVGLLNINVRLKQHNSVTKFVATTAMNLVTPNAAPKLELLFNKPGGYAEHLSQT